MYTLWRHTYNFVEVLDDDLPVLRLGGCVKHHTAQVRIHLQPKHTQSVSVWCQHNTVKGAHCSVMWCTQACRLRSRGRTSKLQALTVVKISHVKMAACGDMLTTSCLPRWLSSSCRCVVFSK